MVCVDWKAVATACGINDPMIHSSSLNLLVKKRVSVGPKRKKSLILIKIVHMPYCLVGSGSGSEKSCAPQVSVDPSKRHGAQDAPFTQATLMRRLLAGKERKGGPKRG